MYGGQQGFALGSAGEICGDLDTLSVFFIWVSTPHGTA